jgi:hypothetical protein
MDSLVFRRPVIVWTGLLHLVSGNIYGKAIMNNVPPIEW